MLAFTFCMVFLSFPASVRSSTSVNLTSSLRQPYLCPNDQEVTFTCTAAGSDLVWMVNNIMLSYNSIAPVGALRSNFEYSITSAFISIWGSSDNGFAYRRAVLTISAQSGAVNPVTVACHNGSTSESQNSTFIPDSKVPSLVVSTHTNHFNVEFKAWTIGWQSDDQNILDYYKLQLNEEPQMLLKSNTAQIFVSNSSRQNRVCITAVDRCAQEGPEVCLTPASYFTPYISVHKEHVTSISQTVKEVDDNSKMEYISSGTTTVWQAVTAIPLLLLLIIGW